MGETSNKYAPNQFQLQKNVYVSLLWMRFALHVFPFHNISFVFRSQAIRAMQSKQILKDEFIRVFFSSTQPKFIIHGEENISGIK